MIRAALALAAAVLLAGCGTLRPQVPQEVPLSWDAYRTAASALQNWALDGKIGIRNANDSHAARLSWQQDTPDYRIELSGPLGQGGALIRGNGQGVSIDIAGEGQRRAATPEALLQKLFGWSFPVREVTYWIRGLPAPDSPYTPKFHENRLENLEQDGWLIHYSGYSEGGALGLPTRVRMKRADLTITVIIKEWTTSRGARDGIVPAKSI